MMGKLKDAFQSASLQTEERRIRTVVLGGQGSDGLKGPFLPWLQPTEIHKMRLSLVVKILLLLFIS